MKILRIIGLVIFVSSSNATFSLMNRFMSSRTVVFRESQSCKNVSVTETSKYAIIIHGWREACDVTWVLELARNLRRVRGGCIICMDYSDVARNPNYLMLAKKADDLSEMIADKLREMDNRGYRPENAYMFGFSLGGRLALEGGRLYGKQKVAEIDVCDNAGPGFDIFEQHDSKQSAQNVQCIHTSRDKGTRTRDCHQDWNMGFCGRRQMAAGVPPRGSHGLCPIFYNAAFHFDFLAEDVPRQCRRPQDYYGYWPEKFKMGYMERRKFQITGEFYSSTTQKYPYTPHVTNESIRRYRRTALRMKNKKFRWN